VEGGENSGMSTFPPPHGLTDVVQNEEKKKLAQLRKEQEEERQLAELQRLQEQSTGRKRVEKLDWMYAAPSNEGGALGGARIGEKEMEDYLLGKRRVDEVLKAGEQNVSFMYRVQNTEEQIGNAHKEFIAIQNANTARDTAAKIREDPLLAIKQQEQAAMAALANRPEIRKKLKEMQKRKGESKEERKARKKAEKEVGSLFEEVTDEQERRHVKHEKRHSSTYDDSRSPRSDYSDERDYKRSRRDSSSRRESDLYSSRRENRSYDSHRDRSLSPKRERRGSRDDNPRQHGHRSDSPSRRNDRRDQRNGYFDDPRIPPPRHYPNGHDTRDVKSHPSRPSAMDMADRPTSSRPTANGTSLDDMRAARLAAMSSSADQLYSQRTQSLAQRAEEEKRQAEKDERMRSKYGKDEANAQFYKMGGEVGLSESLQRRAGKGLQRDI